jgi:hypothetical protein
MNAGDWTNWLVEHAAKMTIGDWINSVVAVATVVMAGATYYLARLTGRLAKDTVAATKQADRHHQENRRPFCVIAFHEASLSFPFGAAFAPENRKLGALMANSGQITQSAMIYVRGELQNKGAGPATDVFVYLNARLGEGEDGALRLTRPVFAIGLVAADETTAIDVQITERDIMHAWDGEKWSPTQAFHAIAGQAYEVVLEYKDVFGNPFRTVHSRGIWTPPVPNVRDATVRAQMMVRPDRPSPIFLTGTQAVRTLADAPALPPPLAPLSDDHQFEDGGY